jgi:hypothetical protein
MRATHGRLSQLNVTIRCAFRAPKGHSSTVRSGRPHESDLLTSIAAGNDLETPREKLQRPVRRSPIAHGRAVDRGAHHRVVRQCGPRQGIPGRAVRSTARWRRRGRDRRRGIRRLSWRRVRPLRGDRRRPIRRGRRRPILAGRHGRAKSRVRPWWRPRCAPRRGERNQRQRRRRLTRATPTSNDNDDDGENDDHYDRRQRRHQECSVFLHPGLDLVKNGLGSVPASRTRKLDGVNRCARWPPSLRRRACQARLREPFSGATCAPTPGPRVRGPWAPHPAERARATPLARRPAASASVPGPLVIAVRSVPPRTRRRS